MPGKSLLLNLNLSINGLKPLAFALATLSCGLMKRGKIRY
uniref:Uncharacterized protein n=1 Tax=Cucumis melo TaxID=3656 RepID=A0A9I9D178_CUCME